MIESVTEAHPVLWDALSWPEVEEYRANSHGMVILPVNVDSVLAETFCLYASAKTGVCVLPTLTYGCSLGHTDRWPGTISLMPETLMAIIREIADFLIRTGFKRLLLVNSHWGNTSSLRCAIDRVRFAHAGRFQIGLRNTFEITRHVWSQFIDDGEDFHANRAETALMLFIDPKSVRKDKIQDDPDRTGGKVFTYVVPQTSNNGLTGAPSRATLEDGRELFLEIGDALAAIVNSAKTEISPLDWQAQELPHGPT